MKLIGIVVVVPTMVGNAKSLVQDPRSRQYGENWRRENDKVCLCKEYDELSRCF